ncbi:MAG: hypothetical protein MUC92_03105 [Fimbriimonadaceae bacterium]|jgi:LPS-assembly protein|nr:hypothetical protein [Fimbriimonadaceae bacterium]
MAQNVGPLVEQGVSQSQGQELAFPAPSERNSSELRIVKASEYVVSGNEIEASGGVILESRGYRLEAERIVGDKSTEVFTLFGNARLTGQTETLLGEEVEINLRDRTFRFRNGKAALGPERLQAPLTGPVYIRSSGGSGSESSLTLRDGELTTCDQDSPHFNLKAKSLEVIPGDRALLRGVRLQVLGRTIVHIPALAIPLKEDSRRFLPEVGQSRDEGYFIKTRWSSPLARGGVIDGRLDLMSKLGVGTGFDWRYFGTAVGGVSAYAIFGPQAVQTLNATHRQALGSGSLSLETSFQRNNYLTAPESTLWNSRGSWVRTTSQGQTRFGFVRVENKTGNFSSLSQNFTLGNSTNWGQGLRTSLELNYSDSANRLQSSFGGVSVDSQRLDVRFSGQKDWQPVSAEFQYQRAVPVGGNIAFSGSSDRTPMVSLTSDARRLFGRSPDALSARLEVGELSEGDRRLTRLFADFASRQTSGFGGLRLNYGGRLRQGLYSDDTAQYVLDYDGRLSYQVQGKIAANLNYRNLRQFGFTPFAIDRTGRNDAFNLDLTWNPSSAWTLAASTGYDILQSTRGQVPWQFVNITSNYQPNGRTRVTGAAVYDTFNSKWNTFRADAAFFVGEVGCIFGARYDAFRSVWSGFNIQLTGIRSGKTRIDALLSYNGYTKYIEAQQYQLIYDLHCTEAVLEVSDTRVGFRSGRQISLSVRIKAFPFGNNFGIGQRGQRIGSGIGF